jgi:hypothetical protein
LSLSATSGTAPSHEHRHLQRDHYDLGDRCEQ